MSISKIEETTIKNEVRINELEKGVEKIEKSIKHLEITMTKLFEKYTGSEEKKREECKRRLEKLEKSVANDIEEERKKRKLLEQKMKWAIFVTENPLKTALYGFGSLLAVAILSGFDTIQALKMLLNM